ncbi:MAG: 50S ribosomal protein L29 [Actinobacteria bacterium ADurb.Bin346]|nr:MAG: 50S ribosomal protein L29 [Actinobacteria bacterium ADurb.Bin346]
MKEIKEKTKEELESKLSEIKKNMLALKFKKASGQLDNFMAIPNLKKDVAKIKTVLRQKELGIS